MCCHILSERAVLSGFMALSFAAAIGLIGGNRKYVRELYNREV